MKSPFFNIADRLLQPLHGHIPPPSTSRRIDFVWECSNSWRTSSYFGMDKRPSTFPQKLKGKGIKSGGEITRTLHNQSIMRAHYNCVPFLWFKFKADLIEFDRIVDSNIKPDETWSERRIAKTEEKLHNSRTTMCRVEMPWNHSSISLLTNPESPESIKKSYGLILFHFSILFSFWGLLAVLFFSFLFIIIILFFSLLLLLFHSTTEWKCAFIFLTRHTHTHTPVNQLATKVLANSLRGLRNEKKTKETKKQTRSWGDLFSYCFDYFYVSSPL